FVSRLSILLAGVVGVIVAIKQPPTVFALVIFAFGTLGNSFLVPYICSVYRKNSNKVRILSAMISGIISHSLWTSFDWQSVTGIHPFLVGLIVFLILMMVGNQQVRRSSKLLLEVVEVAKKSRGLRK